MFYSIRHITRFRYSGPVHESVMELRMQPRSEAAQTLCNFQISTNPRAQLDAYTDHYGNAVYHFNVLRQHSELRVDATSVVEVKDQEPLPNCRCYEGCSSGAELRGWGCDTNQPSAPKDPG